jgi:Putative peptidoglycan binding domain
MMFNRRRKLMRQRRLPALCLVVMLAMGIRAATAQTNGPVVQNGPRTTASNAARPSNARPNGVRAPLVPRGPSNVGPRSPNALPMQMPAQPIAHFRSNRLPFPRQVNPTIRTTRPQPAAPSDPVQPAASVLVKNELTENRLPFTNLQRNLTGDGVQSIPARSEESEMVQRGFRTINAQKEPKPQEETADKLKPREGRHGVDRSKGRNINNRLSYLEALRSHRHEWHDRDWWHERCKTIVLVNTGYYFLNGSYWYPAFGYDPLYSYYDYDGPIYTYGNLLPDQVIANVQAALQDAGYYFGAITGSLSVETRAALANFQRDYGLIITGAIDEPTVEALGLY